MANLRKTVGGRPILAAAGLPAGWTRRKAGPQAEKPAPQLGWKCLAEETSGIRLQSVGQSVARHVAPPVSTPPPEGR